MSELKEAEPWAWCGGREAALAECHAAAMDNRIPFPDLVSPIDPVTVEDDDALTAADLVSGLLDRCEPVSIPGTNKKVHVFPLGDGDYSTMLQWAMEKSASDEPKDPQLRIIWNEETRMRLQACQVLLCCRQKPKRNSRPSFHKGDYETIRRLLTRQTIAEICRVSDSLGCGEELLGPGVRSFFAAAQNYCAIWSSTCANSAASPPGLAEVIAQLGSLASRALSRGSWDSGHSDSLKEL